MGSFGLENMPQGVLSVVRELPESALVEVAAAAAASSRTTGYLDVHSCYIGFDRDTRQELERTTRAERE